MSIEYKDILDWEVLTPTGWKSFCGVKKTSQTKHVKLLFESGVLLYCSTGHKLKRIDGTFVDNKRIRIGTKIFGKGGQVEKVVEKNILHNPIDLYDLVEVGSDKQFYSNGVVSHNCAFIDGVEEIWLSAQSTLSTGGKATILSTPNGVGNFFHKKWVEAESGEVIEGMPKFNPISLPWHLHPERDQTWRDLQTKNLGPKGAAQECDCEFSTSGNTVIEIPLIQWYEKTHMCDPIEKRGFDRGYWIYKYPEAGKSYMVVGDVARGDGTDYSAAHILELESMEQVAEYKGKLPTKEYAQALMTMATEYNKALLVIENANVGWAVIQEVIDKNYDNLFYSSADLQYVDVETQMTNKINTQERKMTPGFTTSNKSRPLLISKLESYIRNKEVIIHSKRLLDELNVFIWKSTGTSSAKAEAMDGYNDDLVMSLGIGLWIRDVALRLRKDSDNITKTILGKIGSTSSEQIKNNVQSLYRNTTPFGTQPNPWQMKIGGPGGSQQPVDLTWLLK